MPGASTSRLPAARGVDRVLERVVGRLRGGGAGTLTTVGVYVTAFVPVPFVPRTCSVIPLTLDTPPLAFGRDDRELLRALAQEGRCAFDAAGTLDHDRVRRARRCPASSSTMPPLRAGERLHLAGAGVGEVDVPAGRAGAGPGGADEVALDRDLPAAGRRHDGDRPARRDLEQLGPRLGTAGSSQAVPEIGSSGRSSWVVRPGQASAGVVAISRFGL